MSFFFRPHREVRTRRRLHDDIVKAITRHPYDPELVRLIEAAISTDAIMTYVHGRPVVDAVQDYGADNTGTNNTDAAIQASINALPVAGGIVYHRLGTYKAATRIDIGNGTSAALSTRAGVRLLGEGMISAPELTNVNYPGNNIYGGARILWNGANSAQMMQVNGPLGGWGLENLVFDGGTATGMNGLNVISAQLGRVKHLYFRNCVGPIAERTVPLFASITCNTMHNRWDSIVLVMPDQAFSIAWLLTGQATDASTDTAYEYITNVTFDLPALAAGHTSHAIYHQTCDNVYFGKVHMAGYSGRAGSAFCATYSYDGFSSSFPQGNVIDCVDFGTAATAQFTNNATVPGGGATANKIVNILRPNGRPANPTLANLQWGWTAGE